MLDEIALKYGTDKSSNWHNYGPVYDKFFLNTRETISTVVEIGIENGKSLPMWAEYFVNAKIIGIDILEKCKQYEQLPKIDVIIGDINSNSTIDKLPNNIDICIDDGSHKHSDQINAFEKIFPKITPGGYFVCEDTWAGYGTDPFYRWTGPITFVNYCKQLVDEVNFRGHNPCLGRDTKKLIEDCNKNPQLQIRVDIDNISFYNSLVFIQKRI